MIPIYTYRYTDFSELGIKLPQLPYDLHPVAGQRKFPKDHDVEKEEDDDYDEINEPSVTLKQHPVQLYPFGRLVPEIKAVVIEPSVRTQSSNFRLGGDYRTESQAVGALAGPKGLGLGFYNRQGSRQQPPEVSRAVQRQGGLVYPYPLIITNNYHLNYPHKVVYQNYVQRSPQHQRLIYSPWFLGK